MALIEVRNVSKIRITSYNVCYTKLLRELMFGMLGLGGLRTFEKIKGVAKR